MGARVDEGRLAGARQARNANLPGGLRRAHGLGGFAVLGVNHGRAFTANPCLGVEWRAAPGPRALYVNPGYNPDNYDRSSEECRAISLLLGESTEDQRRAYAIGCGEAVYALEVARAAGAANPLMWWLDVESVNSWDELDLTLNRYALQGAIDQLAALHGPVGIYSTFRDWRLITGSWSSPAISANWVAGRSPVAACAVPGFSGAPVWLAQEAAPWPDPSAYDSDWAC